MQVDRQKNPGIFILVLVILSIMALFAALAPANDIEQDLDLPVDGVLRRKEPAKPITISTPVPDAPDPPEQEDPKPPTIYGMEVKSESGSIVFVIDRSGSMGMDLEISIDNLGQIATSDRMGRAKSELTKSIASLPMNFKFDVVSFDTTVETLWGELRVANEINKPSACGWVMALAPGGATSTGLAMARGLSYKGNKMVILITDGQPNGDSIRWCGNVPPELHRQDIAWFNASHDSARVNVVGIACPSGSLMEEFCRGVAQDSGGIFINAK
mgnify:FL=1